MFFFYVIEKNINKQKMLSIAGIIYLRTIICVIVILLVRNWFLCFKQLSKITHNHVYLARFIM